MDQQQPKQQQQQAFQPAQQPASATPLSPPIPTGDSLSAQIKAHKTAVIVASIGILLLSGMGTYLVISPSQKTLVAPATLDPNVPLPPRTTPKAKPTPTTQPTTPTPTTPSTAWKSYTNSTYNYSIKYPPDWTEKDLGALEPKVPSYIVFNSPDATSSARNITISVSTRSYTEELALGASNSATTVARITGTKQYFQDSDGNTSTVITLPRTSNLLVLRAKTAYISTFNQMLTTLQITK